MSRIGSTSRWIALFRKGVRLVVSEQSLNAFHRIANRIKAELKSLKANPF